MDKPLFLSILAMDSYNRGYGSGINLGANSDANGTRISSAIILVRNGGAEARSAGFYALAYDVDDVTASNGSHLFSPGNKVITKDVDVPVKPSKIDCLWGTS
jgi:hypothetical protein